MVREDSLTLYGFGSDRERSLFLKLIGVSGIGPKIALAALSGPPFEELVAALRNQDVAVLIRLPGIGKKTAERIVIELKDKIQPSDLPTAPQDSADSGIVEDAMQALMALGIAPASARQAVSKAMQKIGVDQNVQQLIRQALQER